MFMLAGVSASARPFVISGIAVAMPPVPVLVADACAGPLEPELERELAGAQSDAWPDRRPERHMVVAAIQLATPCCRGGCRQSG